METWFLLLWFLSASETVFIDNLGNFSLLDKYLPASTKRSLISWTALLYIPTYKYKKVEDRKLIESISPGLDPLVRRVGSRYITSNFILLKNIIL